MWPIGIDHVRRAHATMAAYLAPTPLRRYAALDAAVGQGVRVWVKHENYNPTNSFKARNALSAMTSLTAEQKARGVVAATRGNHGQGLAWAGELLGIPVTICVPLGNNADKNEAMRGYGATLIEEGRDYDEAALVAERLVVERGLHLVHSTNDRDVIAGAGTLTLEILEERPDLDALVLAVGGGSQAVGGLVVARALRAGLSVYGVQAQGASAIFDAWRTGVPRVKASADTFADGIATRGVYAMTFEPLREGLAGFVTVSDEDIARAMRLIMATTHSLVEGAGAAGLAGLFALREKLAGQSVGIVLSGSNVDAPTLTRVLSGNPYP